MGRFGEEVFADTELVLVENSHGRDDLFVAVVAVVAVGARNAQDEDPLVVELGRGLIANVTGCSGRGLLLECSQKLVKMSV